MAKSIQLKTHHKHHVVYICFFLLCLATPITANDSLERLKNIEKKIRASSEKLSSFAKEAKEINGAIESAQAQEAKLLENVRQTRQKLASLKKEQQQLDRDITKRTADIAQQQTQAQRTAAMALSMQHGGVIEIMLHPDPMPKRLQQQALLNVVLKQIEAYLYNLEQEQHALTVAKKTLTTNISEQQKLEQQQSKQLAQAKAQQEQLKSTLSVIKQDQTLTRSVLNELKSSRQELEQVLKNAHVSNKKTSQNTTSTRPATPFIAPVSADLLLMFGTQLDPIFNVEIEHPGWTYRTTTGTPVKAAAAGEVVYTGWLKGYGNLIVLAHPNDYFTLYGYLDTIAVGKAVQVKQGDILGQSGSSGSMYGPALHFEIRHQRDALNPSLWVAR